MATLKLTPALRAEYQALFNSCLIRPDRMAVVNTLVERLNQHRDTYQSVANEVGVPWGFVAVIHNMEASQRFDGHLHNGDPLTARTVHVPAGRPAKGNPPFKWAESAADALRMKKLGPASDWTLPGTLFQLELFNGIGYRRFHPHVLTPYLWSFSNHYKSGKYISDGTWSETAVSAQCGSTVLLRRMAENGFLDFEDQPAPVEGARPIIVSHSNKKPDDPAEVAKAIALQNWLNTFPGIFVKVDGTPGDRTSAAFFKVTGRFLPGDPRG